MKKVKKALVATVAFALAFGAASEVLGQSLQHQLFDECVAYTPTHDRQFCCNRVGGSWVEIFDNEGFMTDAYCELDDGPGEYSPDSETTPTSGDPRVGTTSGTYEWQQPTATPTRTGTTSGTYAGAESSPAPTSGGTTPTSGTYAR